MITPLENRHVILGVTGSIAAYKAADLASKLAQSGAQVDVILTQAASQFITPLSFQSVTGRPAFTDRELWEREGHVLHIGLARIAGLMVIAPASANTLAKLAHGIADNLLTVTALAARCPIMVAPAMDGGMFAHPATQTNLEILRQRGVVMVGPVEGHLASGLSGIGRMAEPQELIGHIRWMLARDGILRGKKVVVTAGGTQEPIDPVRAITNRSSGKQGFALAQAALDRGAEVILISGPTHLPTPVGASRVDVQTAEQMSAAVLNAIPKADVLIMAAAVADFRPASPAAQKFKREKGLPQITLEATPDILGSISVIKSTSGFPRIMVGFAAESQDVLSNALRKLHAKGLDLIIANDISASDAGFSVDTNRVTILDAAGGEEVLPLLSKSEVSEAVLERIIGILG
jgi:phosphopantothenoylcysteine decarboxylase/phosphopantothenate--cysteine ligase